MREDINQYRKKLLVADLINDVLCDKISVAGALAKFPHDNHDINIKCAFDALVHREADEDLRKKVQDYAQVQDEFLHDLSNILKDNGQIPVNIIKQYEKYHKDDLISPEIKKFKDVMEKLKRIINF